MPINLSDIAKVRHIRPPVGGKLHRPRRHIRHPHDTASEHGTNRRIQTARARTQRTDSTRHHMPPTRTFWDSRLAATSHHFSSASTPTARTPKLLAATNVVPDPANGSTTSPPGATPVS